MVSSFFQLKVTARGSWLIVYPVEIIEYIGLSKDQKIVCKMVQNRYHDKAHEFKKKTYLCDRFLGKVQ